MVAVLLRKEEYKKSHEFLATSCETKESNSTRVSKLTAQSPQLIYILEARRFHFNKGCLIDFLTLLLINAPFQKSVNE